jgi:hypothetical protein
MLRFVKLILTSLGFVLLLNSAKAVTTDEYIAVMVYSRVY